MSVYITCPSRDEAEIIARALVEERLAACVNILPGIHALYRWQGKVEAADEVALIAKTKATLFAAVESRVKSLNSNTTPCIVAWPIVAGHQPYLEWIGSEVHKLGA